MPRCYLTTVALRLRQFVFPALIPTDEITIGTPKWQFTCRCHILDSQARAFSPAGSQIRWQRRRGGWITSSCRAVASRRSAGTREQPVRHWLEDSLSRRVKRIAGNIAVLASLTAILLLLITSAMSDEFLRNDPALTAEANAGTPHCPHTQHRRGFGPRIGGATERERAGASSFPGAGRGTARGRVGQAVHCLAGPAGGDGPATLGEPDGPAVARGSPGPVP